MNLALFAEPSHSEPLAKLMTPKCRFQAACANVIHVAMCPSVSPVCANQLETAVRGHRSFWRDRAPEVRWCTAAAKCNIEVEGCFFGKGRT
jgi:hypothetical protein